MEHIELEKQRLRSTWVHASDEKAVALNKILKTPISREVNGEELLRRPEVTYPILTQLAAFAPAHLDTEASEQVEIQTKYQGYIQRQQDEIEKSLRHEKTRLPLELDYEQIKGLSNEVVVKLKGARPETIGQASRISGITPAAISILLVHLKKQGMLKKGA